MAVSHLACPLAAHYGLDLFPYHHVLALSILLPLATLLHKALKSK